MLRGMIAVNNLRGIHTPYLPPGTYIRVNHEDFLFQEEYVKSAIDEYYITPIHVIVIENNELIAYNQSEQISITIGKWVQELTILSWYDFKIDPNHYKTSIHKIKLLAPAPFL